MSVLYKKFTLLAVVFYFVFFTAEVYAYQLPATVDAGIFYGSSASAEFTVKASSVFNSSGELIYASNYSCSFSVANSGDDVVRVFLDGAEVCSGESALLFEADDGITAVSGKSYRGKIKAAAYKGKLVIINRVGLEDYVKGVIAKEMSPSWHIEALKAQAVCARNYVITQLGRHGSSGFDVCCSEHCQVYGGLDAETESTNLAVEQTSNVIALYDGKPATLFFSAAAGEMTEDVRYVWGSAVPYLVSVSSLESEKNPYYRWEYRVSRDKATKLLASYGLGDITDISIVETSPSGAVTKLLVSGTFGEKLFTLEGTRTVFGYGALKSQAYTLEKGASGMFAVTSGGVVGLTSFCILDSDMNKNTAPSSCFAVSSDGKTAVTLYSGEGDFVFKGRGFGHLVGLSQYGAYEMAKSGFGYADIIKHYFKGVDL